MTEPLLTDRSGKPPFIQPVLRALDRLRENQEVRGADELNDRARALIGAGAGCARGFAYAPTGILGEHTHYFDGFAILMPLPLGIAVAAQEVGGDTTEITFEGGGEGWSIGVNEDAGEGVPEWVRLVHQIFRDLAPGRAVSIGVVSTVYSQCFDAYVAALSVSAARAALALGGVSSVDRQVIRGLKTCIETTTGMPFGSAYVIGALYGEAGRILLVDTATFEYLPVDVPADEELAWCLVQAGRGPVKPAAYYQEQKVSARRALEELQGGAFPELASFRDLEHRDLERALSEITEPRRAIVRHLVTENRRVQKMVVALRKGDWQFVGALLLMSQASMSNDWKSTSTEVDRVVEMVETLSIEGMHGACMSSRGGCAIVCGRRYMVSKFLEHLHGVFRQEFGYEPAVILL